MYPSKPEAKVVAEIGCNHQGSMDLAKKLIDMIAWSGAYAFKLQKRNPVECLSPQRYAEPYTSYHSFGKTYGEHREYLELSIIQHEELMEYGKEKGLVYSTSVWDQTSYREVTTLDPLWIKIPSAHNEDWPLLAYIAADWTGMIQISNGMIEDKYTEGKWKSLFGDRLIPMACSSSYPASSSDVCLLDIPRLKRDLEVLEVGFSGHHTGIQLDIAAVMLGATWVERHVTLDRSMKGTDNSASLEPSGLMKLVRDIKVVGEAWHIRQGLLESEVAMVKKLKVMR